MERSVASEAIVIATDPKIHVFPKLLRLVRPVDFERVHRQGKAYHLKNFIVVTLAYPQDRTRTRLGISAGKKVGNAVRRNRIKRLVREVFRTHPEYFPAASDVLVIVRRQASQDLSYRSVQQEFSGFAKRSGGSRGTS